MADGPGGLPVRIVDVGGMPVSVVGANANGLEIASIDTKSILLWGTPLPSGTGIANALKRSDLQWSFIPAVDMEVKFTLSCQLGTATVLQVTHLSLLDTIALAAGQSNINAQILDLVTPQNSGITGVAGFTMSSSGRRFCKAGVLASVAAYAWYSGTAPTVGSILCNGPAGVGNSPHTSLRIERVG